jgi:NAD(P)H-hydrate repair Nnr-like enzyme with NAD(P)H-hydrate dehydratase domain
VDAASAGAYVHGLAGALAASSSGEGSTAGDVLDRLPRAVGEVLGA